MSPASLGSPDEIAASLAEQGYLSDEGLATVAYLALAMHRPLFLEGEAGVGKTALADALAEALGRAAHPAAVLRGHRRVPGALRLGLPAPDPAPAGGRGRRLDARSWSAVEESLYDERFLLARPLLRALRESPAVLLVDEIDRADDEFEAFLLEVLSTHQVTIPELGTISAATPPIVVLTSNRTREVHDALKRRCLYHWIEHPGLEREVEILRTPAARGPEGLAAQVAARRAAAARARPAQAARRRRDAGLGQGAGRAGRPELDVETAAATLGAVLSTARTPTGCARRSTGCSRLRRRTTAARSTTVGFALRSAHAGVPVTGRPRSRRSSSGRRTLDVGNRGDVYWAGRATLCAGPDDLARYDAVFAAWFSGERPARRGGRVASAATSARSRPRPIGDDSGAEPARTRCSRSVASARPRCCGTATSPSLTDAERAELARLFACSTPRLPPAGPPPAPAPRGASTRGARVREQLRAAASPARCVTTAGAPARAASCC